MQSKKPLNIEDLIALALQEDLPSGDITTDGLDTKEKNGTCLLIAKQDLTLSGSSFFSTTIQQLEPSSTLSWNYKDGDSIATGKTVCEVTGNLIQILKAERVALNFLGHFSGIATLTKEFVVAAPSIKILDTRKTLPLYREFQKKAVRDGGGHNHRMNLSDAILIKENHICAAGGLETAIANIKINNPDAFIEVEVQNFDETKQALALGAHRLLLDNMTDKQLLECLQIIPENVQTEASGNMNVNRVKKLNSFILDYISVGALTHSAANADFSLLFQWQ